MSNGAGRRCRRGEALRLSSARWSVPVAVLAAVDALEPRFLFAGFPVVQSIVRGTPATAETSASVVTYGVTFDQPVTGVDPSDFRVACAGGVAVAGAVSVTPNSSSNYSVTVSEIHGSGSVSLELVDDDSIRNAASNPLGGAGAGNGSFVGPDYLIDQTFPTVLSVNRAGGAPATTSGPGVDFTVTFSKPVTGIAVSNFAVGAGAGVQVSGGLAVVAVNGSTYTVHVSGISGNGSVGLNLVNPAGIHDAAGNPLADASGAVAFQPQQTMSVGATPRFVQVTDLNSDGRADLLVANTGANNIGVMAGQPGGTLGPQVTFAINQPEKFVVADVNGDGKSDVVVVGSDRVASLLLGNGDGSLGVATTFSAGGYSRSVATADFNGDGRPDLVFGRTAVRGQSQVSVLLSTGAGGFSQPLLLSTGDSPLAVSTADLNNDGYADIVSANANGSSASVILGNGDGTFQTSKTYAVGAFPIDVTTADVNGDGNLDIVTPDFNAGRVSVLMGNGNGTFQNQLTFTTGSYPAAVRIADLNGDGKPDLVVCHETENTLGTLPGNGNGTFGPLQTFATGTLPIALDVGDVDGDGRGDVVVANETANSVSAFRSSPPGIFVGQTYQVVGPSDVVTGTSGSDEFAIVRNVDNIHIDWGVGSASGQMLINDANGLTLNGLGGNDVLTLDYSHGSPLPNTLHVNGIFSVSGLTGTNPLQGITLDIRQSTVYLNNASGQTPLSLIRTYIANGFNQGAWNGTPTPSIGVITSTTAASNPLNTFGVGYADSTTGAVAGQPLNTIELRYTVMGDSNLDATVNSLDAIIMARNYAIPGATTWIQGDFNYDAAVNMFDATLLQKNFNLTLPPVSFSTPAAAISNPLPSISSPTLPPTQPISADNDDTDSPTHPKRRHDRKRR